MRLWRHEELSVWRVCATVSDLRPAICFSQQRFAVTQIGPNDCLGTTDNDPVGTTFDEVYNGHFYYVIWNDQFYNDPAIASCNGPACGAPWGGSKGLLAWDDKGEGFVMQVSAPSWPASGSALHPRKTDGNTLGCVKDNNVTFSQHFFALRLTKADLINVLKGMRNASIVTDPKNLQVVNNGGPADIHGSRWSAWTKIDSGEYAPDCCLSSGVGFISKPSGFRYPGGRWSLRS